MTSNRIKPAAPGRKRNVPSPTRHPVSTSGRGCSRPDFFRPFFWTLFLFFFCSILTACFPTTRKTSEAALHSLDIASPITSDRTIPQEAEAAYSPTEYSGISDLEIASLENPVLEKETIDGEELLLPSEEEITTFEAQEAASGNQPPPMVEVEETTEPTITFDYPMAMNRKVEFFLNHFQNTQPENFRKWLSRSTRYLPMIQKQLKEAGMPQDLAYLPMIESGYRLTAYSSARAAGPWQFLRSTGRMYGLEIDNYIDERRDPVKSTKAAISFLKDLYREFDDWHLATAAYNGGSGRIRSAIRKTGSTDFWTIAASNHIKRETKYYVPKLIAALMIAKNPEQYGFTGIEYEPPMEYEVLEVPRWTTLQAVAIAGDMQLEDLRNLNRQLRRTITPPGSRLYPLKVPADKKEMIAKNLPRVNAVVTTSYKTHVVKKGDTLTRICNSYNIDKKTLLKANDLRTADLIKGQRLRIPYKSTRYKLLTESQIASRIAPAEMAPENLVTHTVKPGETISELARRYNVPMHMIAAWNGLNDLNSLRAGQQLSFYLQDLHESDNNRLASLSGTGKNSLQELQPGKKLKVNLTTSQPEKASSKNARSKPTYYQVKGGDSLWAIAEKYQTTPEKIRQWNSMEGSVIYPGHRLLLHVAEDVDA